MRTIEDRVKVILAKHYECKMSMYEAVDEILAALKNALDDEFHKIKHLEKTEILDKLRLFRTRL